MTSSGTTPGQTWRDILQVADTTRTPGGLPRLFDASSVGP
jgi:hypothetical protein